MSRVPRAFRARIAGHNRHCWLAAALSLLGACLVWMFFGAIFTGGVLVFEAIRTGDTNLLNPPPWFFPAGTALILALFLLAAIDRRVHRYRLPSDRSIIGWHLIPDVLFLPASMTLAIWDHIGARIVLTRREQEEAWRLLRTIFEMEHPSTALLAVEFPDSRLLARLLSALQLSDWIDLHGGADDWYYRVHSDEVANLRGILPAEPET